jgi:hypothetical protein
VDALEEEGDTQQGKGAGVAKGSERNEKVLLVTREVYLVYHVTR